MPEALSRAAPAGSELGCKSLGSLARGSVRRALTTEEHIRARARYLGALEARRRAPHGSVARSWWTRLRAEAVAVAICVAAFGLWSALSDRPVSYVVEGDNLGSGALVTAANAEARVLFSEGSVVRVDPGGSAELAELTSAGARVVSLGGTLHARIEHLPGSRWSFEAGPYVVSVTGTEFSLTWNERDRRLVVELETGSLLVRGPEAPGGVALAAGRRLVAKEGVGTLSVTELGAGSDEAEGAGVSATDDEAPSEISAPTGTPFASDIVPTETAPRSWPELVAAGRYAEVVAQAESAGIDASLASRPLNDLLALADAARYVKRSDLAEKVLITERMRFPTSAQATTAAFLLGRLAEARGGAGEAQQWYQRYLSEAPSGALAEEAMGRLMVLLAQNGSREAARVMAAQYLQRFPAGASVQVAKDLVNEEIEF